MNGRNGEGHLHPIAKAIRGEGNLRTTSGKMDDLLLLSGALFAIFCCLHELRPVSIPCLDPAAPAAVLPDRLVVCFVASRPTCRSSRPRD